MRTEPPTRTWTSATSPLARLRLRDRTRNSEPQARAPSAKARAAYCGHAKSGRRSSGGGQREASPSTRETTKVHPTSWIRLRREIACVLHYPVNAPLRRVAHRVKEPPSIRDFLHDRVSRRAGIGAIPSRRAQVVNVGTVVEGAHECSRVESRLGSCSARILGFKSRLNPVTITFKIGCGHLRDFVAVIVGAYCSVTGSHR